MASLIRRTSGIFYCVTSEGRKRVWRSLGTRDPGIARQSFVEISREWLKRNRATLSGFFEDFLARAPLHFSPKTIVMYRGAMDDFVRICGEKLLKSVTVLDVERFKQRRAEEVSAVSVNIQFRTLRAAFNEAKRLKLIEENPFSSCRQVRQADKEASYLSETEFRQLVASIEDPEFAALVRFAVYTMMRLGELVNLKWSNIDLERREIHVRNDPSTGFRMKCGKPRLVPMKTQGVYDFLLLRRRLSVYVFHGPDGNRLNPTSVSHRFKSYCQKAGLSDGVHFHSLRHTGISWLVRAGVPVGFASKIAGHSREFTTSMVYTHFESNTLLSAVDKLPSLN